MSSADSDSFAWRVPELMACTDWRFHIEADAAAEVAQQVQRTFVPGQDWFEYQGEELNLDPIWPQIAAGVHVAHAERGLALVSGLPRRQLSEAQFEYLSWCIGLRIGVARPQGKQSQYLAAVKNVGTVYRSAGGRGYSSNADLDFHVDGADLTTLACYNQAPVGGESMVTSSASAWQVLTQEAPDLAQLACRDFCFSRQQEQAPDEPAFYAQPLFDWCEGRLFCKWNRNRIQSAQQLADVPALTTQQLELMDKLDEIIRRPRLMYRMYLAPGDLQIINNHTMLHSRSEFEDSPDEGARRMLVRLWLAPPDGVELPSTWGHFYRATRAGSVRGGILGHHHDARCRMFEARIAERHGMHI
jgi:hypothetical protein